MGPKPTLPVGISSSQSLLQDGHRGPRGGSSRGQAARKGQGLASPVHAAGPAGQSSHTLACLLWWVQLVVLILQLLAMVGSAVRSLPHLHCPAPGHVLPGALAERISGHYVRGMGLGGGTPPSPGVAFTVPSPHSPGISPASVVPSAAKASSQPPWPTRTARFTAKVGASLPARGQAERWCPGVSPWGAEGAVPEHLGDPSCLRGVGVGGVWPGASSLLGLVGDSTATEAWPGPGGGKSAVGQGRGPEVEGPDRLFSLQDATLKTSGPRALASGKEQGPWCTLSEAGLPASCPPTSCLRCPPSHSPSHPGPLFSSLPHVTRDRNSVSDTLWFGVCPRFPPLRGSPAWGLPLSPAGTPAVSVCWDS